MSNDDEAAVADADEELDAETTEDAEEGEAAAEEDADESEEEAEVSGLQDGEFVRLAYTARTVENDTLVDTTDVEVAEEEGVDTENRAIEPRVITLGAGHLFPSVESDLVGKEVGDSGTVTVPATEAFGEFDPDDVRTVSVEKLPEDDRYPGAHVDIDGRHGHVETVIGGRARVDFNHPLAGESIEYEYEIVGDVEDRVERAEGMLSMYVDADLEMWIETQEEEEEVEVEGDDEDDEPETEVQTVEYETLVIESTPQLAMNQQWLFQKQQIAQELMDRLDLDRVVVQETFEGAGMGGLGGLGGMGGLGDIEAALDDVDVDADEILEEIEGEGDLDLDEELEAADADETVEE
jgi:FKBP-type peptidyl-prolyl cis-trans isomerase SlyD